LELFSACGILIKCLRGATANRIKITDNGGYNFEIDAVRHQFNTDQPVDEGGTDMGPSPVELYIASLAGCIAVYAQSFLKRHGLGDKKAEVDAKWEMVKSPNRVGKINITVKPPAELDSSLKDAFFAVAKHCTVHNTIVQPPKINIEMISESEHAAG
jgi:uncharacterized OsmC-like protein